MKTIIKHRIILVITTLLLVSNGVVRGQADGSRLHHKMDVEVYPMGGEGKNCKDYAHLSYYVPAWIYVNEPLSVALKDVKESLQYNCRTKTNMWGNCDGNYSWLGLLTLTTNNDNNTHWVVDMGGCVQTHSWSSLNDIYHKDGLPNFLQKSLSSCMFHKPSMKKYFTLHGFGYSKKDERLSSFKRYDNTGRYCCLVVPLTFKDKKYDEFHSQMNAISVYDFLDNEFEWFYAYPGETSMGLITINHSVYIKQNLSSYFGVKCINSPYCIKGSGKSLVFDPQKVEFKKDEKSKKITLIFTLFNKEYKKEITVHQKLKNLDVIIPFEEYKIYASDHNGNNLKQLLKEQFKDNVFLDDIDMTNIPDKFPNWSSTKYWDYDMENIQTYEVKLNEGVNTNLSKTIKVKMIEDRFKLKDKVVNQAGVIWVDDENFELHICKGSSNYRLANLFIVDFQKGKFKFLKGENVTSDVLNGNGTSGASVKTKKEGEMTIKYIINKQFITFKVKILSKPKIKTSLPDYFCEDAKFMLKDKIKISPDYAQIKEFKFNDEEQDYNTFIFDTKLLNKQRNKINLLVTTGYQCEGKLNKEVIINSKEVSFVEKEILLCSESSTLNLGYQLKNATLGNGVFFKNGVPFSGMFDPKTEQKGKYNIRYEETSGYCKKIAEMTINLETTPNINSIIKDNYIVFISELNEYTETAFLNYIQNDLIGNSYIDYSLNGTFPNNLNQYLDFGNEIILSVKAIMDKNISSDCLSENQTKNFTITLKENRFDLQDKLATLRIKQRGDKLVLCKSDKNDYRLKNLFKEGYRDGTFTCIYTDDDNNPNNDEDAIIINDETLLLNRSVNANITYSLTKDGYTNTFDFIVEVIGVNYADIMISDIPDVCFAKPIDLKPYVFPPKGTFEPSYTFDKPNAITKEGLLIPNLAGKGIHEITYTVGKMGCTKSKRFRLIINDLLPTHFGWLGEIPNICANDEPVNLRNYVNTDKGSFVGSGIGGDYFDPKITGPGLHKINFVFESENNTGCRLVLPATINVLPAPRIKYANIPVQCYRDSLVDIRKYFLPQGGSFNGIGIMDNNGFFEASQAGLGTHKIEYTYTDTNQCSTTYEAEVTVDALIDKNRIIDSLPVLCKDSKPIFLPDFVKLHQPNTVTQKYMFTGKGVQNDYFDPSKLEHGINDIIYTVTEGRCKHQSIAQIKIDRAVGFNFKDFPVLCTKTPLNLDDYVNIKGGSFFGRGIEHNIFYPEQVGEGVYIIDYKYQFPNSCMVSDYKYLTVRSLEPIDFKAENDNVTIKDGEWIKFTPKTNQQSSENNQLKYNWQFSDGDYSYQKDVYKYFYLNWEYVGWNSQYKMNEYKIVGDNKFDVELNITSEGCTKSVKKHKYVTVLPSEDEFLAKTPEGEIKKGTVSQSKIQFTDFKETLIQPKVWYFNESLNIDNATLLTDIEIFDVSGRKMKIIDTESHTDNSCNKFNVKLNKGIYVIKFNDTIHKIFVK